MVLSKNTTKLKEVHIVRYADDFKLFCRKRSDAEKVFIAVKLAARPAQTGNQ